MGRMKQASASPTGPDLAAERAEEKARQLRRMKGIALSLLLIAAIVYLATLRVADQGVWGFVNAGAEAAITNNVTARLEYQYADYGSQLYRTGIGTASDIDFNASTLRAGLGYKF